MSNQATISKKISRNRKPHAKHPGRLPPASIGRTNFPDSRPRRINNIREVHGETPWRKACPERSEGTCLQGPFISFAKLRPCVRSFGLPTVSSEHLARNRTVARDGRREPKPECPLDSEGSGLRLTIQTLEDRIARSGHVCATHRPSERIRNVPWNQQMRKLRTPIADGSCSESGPRGASSDPLPAVLPSPAPTPEGKTQDGRSKIEASPHVFLLKNKATNLLKTQMSVPESDKTIPISDTCRAWRFRSRGEGC